jgi:hypothetical protein
MARAGGRARRVCRRMEDAAAWARPVVMERCVRSSPNGNEIESWFCRHPSQQLKVEESGIFQNQEHEKADEATCCETPERGLQAS